MKTSIALFLFVVLVGCSNKITVFSDSDPDADLWAYKTFGWGPNIEIEKGKNPLVYNELNDKRIKTAVADQLASRGILFDENPELILHYHIIVEDKSVLVTEPYGYSYGPYWMRSETNVYAYREGTLILDLMDTKTNQLVWRGWAVTDLEETYKPAEVESLIKKTVKKIFEKFPRTQGDASTVADK